VKKIQHAAIAALSVLMSLVLSVGASAAAAVGTTKVTAIPGIGGYYSYDEDNNLVVQTINYKGLTDEQQAFMKEFYSLSASDSDSILLIAHGTDLDFIILDNGASSSAFLGEAYGHSGSSKDDYFVKGVLPCRVLFFRYDTSSKLFNCRGYTHYGGTSTNFYSIMTGYLLVGDGCAEKFKTNSHLTNSIYSKNFLQCFGTYDGVKLVDNDDPEPTPTPEPEPTAEPTATPKPYIPSEPQIPPGNEYVPYDTSIWSRFFKHVSGNTGAVANIGFLIFAAWFAWYIIPKLVRHFTRIRH